MNGQVRIPERDKYSEVVSAIHRTAGSRISVPQLATLLGVKSTTLNARFRRENTAVLTLGRTNFVSQDVALCLAELHKYALIGWLTLKRASELTGVKSGTIKAWCESGEVEGHIDLTKRLRVAPSALQYFRPVDRHRNHAGKPSDVLAEACPRREAASRKNRKPNGFNPVAVQVGSPFSAAGSRSSDRARERPQTVSIAHRPPVLPPPPAPVIRIITRKDYGLPEIEEAPEIGKAQPSKTSQSHRKQKGPLTYDPDQPFSVSECAVGRRMRFGPYDGIIQRVFDDPFNPRIQVVLPEHQDPLMKEVQLIVGRKNGS